MDGKKAIVTGAGTGIGRGVAIELAKEGASVVVHYSHSSKGAESAVEEIKKMGGKAKAIKADFTKVSDIRNFAKEAAAFLGGVDLLVNNAGITINMPFEKVTEEIFDTLYSVNIKAQLFLTQALLSELEKSKGVVINFTSGHAFGCMKEHTVYAGTKGAIVAYTRVLSLELAKKGIRVVGLAPGWVRVENQEKSMGNDFDWAAAGKGLPAGFVASPTDMGRIVIFLASQDARFIVGTTVVADGGQTSVLPLTGNWWEPVGIQFGQGYAPGV
jgi:glucose 1-dehydrogenase